MRRKDYSVRCVAEFTHIIPASVLEIRAMGTSGVDSSIHTPEKRVPYTVGQVVNLSGVAARRAFVKAWPGAFEVCE